MSENTKNEKVVVVANLKSPVIGFVLALFLGWLGVDRFYKGGGVSIVLGIIKLIWGLSIVSGLFFVFVFASVFAFALARFAVESEFIQTIMSFYVGIYVLWYVLDLIFVPLEISLDNRKKLAIAQGNYKQEKITKTIGKSMLRIAIGVVVGFVIILVALKFL